jgi:hypothetical protein
MHPDLVELLRKGMPACCAALVTTVVLKIAIYYGWFDDLIEWSR